LATAAFFMSSPTEYFLASAGLTAMQAARTNNHRVVFLTEGSSKGMAGWMQGAF
jgi:hypothetical protein